MSDKNLRSGLIRLAHAKPELRGEILPLLALGRGKKAMDDVPKASPALVAEAMALVNQAEKLELAFDAFHRKADAEWGKFDSTFGRTLDGMDEDAPTRDALTDLGTLLEDFTKLTDKNNERSIQYRFLQRIQDLDAVVSWGKRKKVI